MRDSYLDTIINYGGVAATIGQAIDHMQGRGVSQKLIDRLLQGAESANRKNPVDPDALIPWEDALARGLLD